MSAHRHLRLVPAADVAPDPSEPLAWHELAADLAARAAGADHLDDPPDFAGAWLVLPGGRS